MKSQIKMLKVKIKSLAAEIRIIRLEERKAKGRRLAKRKRNEKGEKDPKYFEFRGRDDSLRSSLMAHRKYDWERSVGRCDLRHEARHSLLAYAFLRGRAYRSVEPKSCRWHAPDWAKVLAMVNRFGSAPGYPNKTTADELAAWATAVPTAVA